MRSNIAANGVGGAAMSDSNPMRHDFADRADLIAYLRAEFPQAAAVDDHIPPTRGGRRAAEAQLAKINPPRYAQTRNFLDGAVTRLSPYIRHGVLSLAAVRNAALTAVSDPQQAGKLINELGWRDYFQRVYAKIGGGIWEDREPYKTGFAADDYADELPDDVRNGRTGFSCVDAMCRELIETGYLHNHARMYLAAYVVHWRRVKWQAGAAWFLAHLLDGDPASNNLSWQWVASTFSHKPYFFNRANFDNYTRTLYDHTCAPGRCPFDGSYEQLEQQLFPQMGGKITRRDKGTKAQRKKMTKTTKRQDERLKDNLTNGKSPPTVVWIHADCLRPLHPALAAYPDAPAIFVWDEALLQTWRISLKRILFMYECLLELPAAIHRGDVAAEVAAFARRHQATRIATSASPSPRFTEICEALAAQGFEINVWQEEPFLRKEMEFDLKRFSRYWRQAKKAAF